MTISERDRHHLHSKAADVMGDQAAETLMSYLPPVGWADVATKRDLDALEERMDLRFGRVDERFAAFERHIDERFRHIDERFRHVDDRFRHVEHRIDALDQVFVTKAEMTGHVRTILMGTAALNASIGTLVVAAVAAFA